MNRVIEIASAWFNVLNPSQDSIELAKERLNVCSTCDSLREVDVKIMNMQVVDTYHMCGVCGCPIRGKVFTPKEQGCPLNKWEK